jgi:hypothetical protein
VTGAVWIAIRRTLSAESVPHHMCSRATRVYLLVLHPLSNIILLQVRWAVFLDKMGLSIVLMAQCLIALTVLVSVRAAALRVSMIILAPLVRFAPTKSFSQMASVSLHALEEVLICIEFVLIFLLRILYGFPLFEFAFFESILK